MDCHRNELRDEMMSVPGRMTVFDEGRNRGTPIQLVFYRTHGANKFVKCRQFEFHISIKPIRGLSVILFNANICFLIMLS